MGGKNKLNKRILSRTKIIPSEKVNWILNDEKRPKKIRIKSDILEGKYKFSKKRGETYLDEQFSLSNEYRGAVPGCSCWGETDSGDLVHFHCAARLKEQR